MVFYLWGRPWGRGGSRGPWVYREGTGYNLWPAKSNTPMASMDHKKSSQSKIRELRVLKFIQYTNK